VSNIIKERIVNNSINIRFVAVLCVFTLFFFTYVDAIAVTDNDKNLESPNILNESFVENQLEFLLGSDMPALHGVAGAFVGTHGDVIIVAGGSNFSTSIQKNGEKIYHDDIYVLRMVNGKAEWDNVGNLPRPIAFGATVSTPKGILCIGGRNKSGLNKDVIFLKYEDGTLQSSRMSVLPETCEVLSGCASGDAIYIYTRAQDIDDSYKLWKYDLASDEWKQLLTFDRPYVVTCQNNGFNDCIYFFSTGQGDGKNYYYYDLKNTNDSAVFKEVSSFKDGLNITDVIALGQSHILCLSDEVKLYYYHTITDTWVEKDDLSSSLQKPLLLNSDKGILLIDRDNELGIKSIYTWSQRLDRKSFAWQDYLVLACYLVLPVCIGLYFSGREKTTSDFFLGGKRIPAWVAGISIMATQVSSIGFMAIPAKSFATNWEYFLGVLSWFIVVPIVTIYFIPFFCKLNVTTAYEYLEYRFGYTIRCFASIFFILMQLVRMTIVLYLPSLALSSVTGLDPRISVIVMGVLCTLYIVAGGIEAVIWIELMQAVLLIGGALLCVCIVIFGFDEGPGAFWKIAFSHGKFDMVRPGYSLALPVVWVVLVGNIFNRTSSLTSDQTVVQRYLTTRDAKQASKALWVDVAASIPWAIIAFMFGTALYVFYKTHPDKLDPSIATDGMVPFFIVQQLPVGLAGLVIAALFAAAMSSFDGSVHSSATVLVNDVYVRMFPKSAEKLRLIIARGLVILLGAFATAMALVLTKLDIKSLWDVFLTITGLMTGPVAGIFILGIFTRRTSERGALLGAFVGVVILYFVQNSGLVHFFLYTAIGLVSSFVAGYMASVLLFPNTTRKDVNEKAQIES